MSTKNPDVLLIVRGRSRKHMCAHEPLPTNPDAGGKTDPDAAAFGTCIPAAHATGVRQERRIRNVSRIALAQTTQSSVFGTDDPVAHTIRACHER